MQRHTMFKSRAVLIGSLVVMAGLGVGMSRTDLMVTRGFGKALEGARPTLTFQPVANGGKTQTGVAGDEGYWLTRAEVESPTPFGKPLALGDHITVSGHDGQARQFEIIGLKAIGTLPGKIGTTSGAQPRLLLVTCRTVGETADKGQGSVRFIVEAETLEPGVRMPAKSL